MSSEPELKYYTVADLRQWLLHNKPKEGLSEKIIAPQRAYAIMNNPYVKDSDAVVSAIFEDEEPAAYTAAFPEILEKPKGKLAWWFSTLYCRPESAGKGYGLIVVGQLCELIGEGNYFDMDGAGETIEIFKHLGLTCSYFTRYIFCEKHINTSSLRGKLAFIFDWCKKLKLDRRKHAFCKKTITLDYYLKYSNYVDDEAYAFIIKHSKDDLLIREQRCLNWLLQYPFMISSPILSRVKCDTKFTSSVESYKLYLVKVYNKNDNIVGLYSFRLLNKEFSLQYLYYNDSYSEIVFSSIAQQFISFKAVSIRTTHENFAIWFRNLNFTSKNQKYMQSFSYLLDSIQLDAFSSIQQGDGDVFV